MLGEGVLMVLTFGDAHLVLDVRVSEKLLEFITRTFACTMGVEDAKALRAPESSASVYFSGTGVLKSAVSLVGSPVGLHEVVLSSPPLTSDTQWP